MNFQLDLSSPWNLNAETPGMQSAQNSATALFGFCSVGNYEKRNV